MLLKIPIEESKGCFGSTRSFRFQNDRIAHAFSVSFYFYLILAFRG